MATTIITKHGTGVPSSLQVGELAIDKSGPTIYTNTGSGVTSVAGAGVGGSGGGDATAIYLPGLTNSPSDGWQSIPTNILEMTFDGGQSAASLNLRPLLELKSQGDKGGIRIKSSGGNVDTNAICTVTAKDGYAFALMTNSLRTLRYAYPIPVMEFKHPVHNGYWTMSTDKGYDIGTDRMGYSDEDRLSDASLSNVTSGGNVQVPIERFKSFSLKFTKTGGSSAYFLLSGLIVVAD